jgi:threonine/homoserine/homoserine lactone efflux protein
MILLLRGILLGFGIAAPVGPIGLLCIRRTLAGGRLAGLLSGLGAASADAVYGSLAAFGLSAVYAWLAGWQPWLKLVGGAFIIWLGVQALRAPLAQRAARGQEAGLGLARAYLSTFLLTLSNPMTILSFLAVFAGAGVTSGGARFEAVWLVLGVFCGSAMWWLLLSMGVHLLGQRLRPDWLQWVNRAAGAGLVVFGLVMAGGELLRLVGLTS